MARSSIILPAVILSALSTFSYAEENDALKRIEEKLSQLAEKVGTDTNDKPTAAKSATPKHATKIEDIPNSLAYRVTNLESKVSAIEEELRRLTNSIEHLTNPRAHTNIPNSQADVEVLKEGVVLPDQTSHELPANQDDLQNEVETQIEAIEVAPEEINKPGSMPLVPLESQKQPPMPKNPAIVGPQSAQDTAKASLSGMDDVAVYNDIQKLIHEKKLDKSAALITSFLEKFPESSLKPNVLYWGGEVARYQKNNEKAAGYFLEVYSNYPKNAVAPEALLKLAHALKALDKSNEALITIEKLETQYPNASETVKKIAQNLKADILSSKSHDQSA